MRLARSAAQVFFPLDEELALLPGPLTPTLHEAVVRLGARLPFRTVVEELARLKHVTTTEASVRRHTESAGAAYVALQTDAVERLERTLPPVPEGAARQLVSPDGAMVPLLHGEWAEVKTVAIGAIQPPVLERGEMVVHLFRLRNDELELFFALGRGGDLRTLGNRRNAAPRHRARRDGVRRQ